MPICTCTIHGDVPEQGSRCSFLVSGMKSVSFNEIKSLFPYVGRYHYRYKHEDFEGFDYVWMDIKEGDEIPIFNNSLELQALVLDFNEDDSAGDDEYKTNASEMLDTDRLDRSPVVSMSNSAGNEYDTTKTVFQNIQKGLQKITKSAAKSALHNASIGAQSIWNAVKSSASQISSIISQSSHLSDTSEENLAELSEMVATLFNNSNPQHIAMIEQLFHVLFPGQPYSRLSDTWKQAGFQKNDPILDLKATGTLAVKCMIYFGSNKSKKCQEMVVANKENIKTNYPFAIVCVNLTLLLIDALSVRDSKYLSVQVGFWEMFEDPNAFYEMFCFCLVQVDASWRARKAVRSEFGAVIGEVNSKLVQALKGAPKKLTQFYDLYNEIM